MRRVILINKFPGLMELASPRDYPYASQATNVDITGKLGVLRPSKGYSDLGLTFTNSDLRQFIESLSPQHGAGVKIFLIRTSNSTLEFLLNSTGSYGSSQIRTIVYSIISDTPLGTITTFYDTVFGDVSFVERNGVIYGGCGVDDNNFPFIFLLTDYKRFEDYDNSGSYYDDWTLGGTPENSYLLENSALQHPIIDTNIRLDTLSGESVSEFSDADYEDFDDGTYGFYFSFIYDGFQESSLNKTNEDYYLRVVPSNIPGSRYPLRPLRGGSTDLVQTTSHNAITFNFEVNPAYIPRRVTGINIWMNILGTTAENLKRTEIRLVKTIPFDWKSTYLGRESDLYNYSVIPQTSKWDSIGSGWWRFIEEPRKDSKIYISLNDYNFGTPWFKSLGFPATKNLYPKYKYNHVLDDIMYAGPVAYNFQQNDYEYHSNIFVWSSPGEFSKLPFTNRGQIKGEITAINSLGKILLVWSLNDLFMYEDGAQVGIKEKRGCYSHFSVVGESNYKYWAGESGFIKFDGFKAVKISNYFVENSYNSLTNDQKSSISGAYDSKNEQIIWSTSSKMFVYNLKDESWTVRNYGFRFINKSIYSDVYSADNDTVYKLDDTYDKDGYAYGSTYELAEVDLHEPDIIKTITLGFIQYKSQTQVSLTFNHLGTTIDTISLESTSGVKKIVQFKVGINAESFDVVITANAEGEFEIDYIDLWGDINDLKGA